MKKYCSLFILLAGWVLGYAQLPLNNAVQTIIKGNNLHPSVAAISIYNISDNVPLASIRGDEYMIPASTLKIISTFTCLDQKGSDFKYETKLGYTGKIEKDGTLIGDIWIVGSGDPSFGSTREGFGPSYDQILNSIHDAISKAGIKCIDGSIFSDPSRFKDGGAYPGWSWNDVGNYYGAGVYGLNVMENEYKVFFNRDMRVSEPTTIYAIDPPIPGMTFQNRVLLDKKGTGDNAYIYGGPGMYQKIIKGTIPAGKGTFSIKGSLPDPPLFFAYMIYSLLEEKGIAASGYDVKPLTDEDPFNQLRIFKSQRLESLIKVANEKSINLYCEAFLRTMAEDGSREIGIRAILSKLDDNGLDTTSLIQYDGSGLSSRNVITANFMTSFLNYYHNKWGGKVFNLLPRASYEGTVKGLLKAKKSKGKAWLKSGFIGGVLSYSGYIKNKEGKIISISIMANNYLVPTHQIREISEQIIEAAYLFSG